MNPASGPSEEAGRAKSPVGSIGQSTAVTGLFLYAAFAPHSVAGAEIAVAIAAAGWLVRMVATGRTGLRRTRFDLPIGLLLLWTVASSFLSEEPQISVPKLQSLWVVLLFYLALSILRRRTAVLLACLLIVSAAVGTLYSIYDLARGRGVVVDRINPESPFQRIHVKPGDTVWRLNGRRVYSLAQIDAILREVDPRRPLTVGLITDGEQVERVARPFPLAITSPDYPGPGQTSSPQVDQNSPSGITGTARNHRFRASGWTRHYETFAELLQIIAQLALGLALANLRNHGVNARCKLALVATTLLALGISLTAMRTTLVAFAIGASVTGWRTLRGRVKLVMPFALLVVLTIGGWIIWQTRAQNALWLGDPSASLRGKVARVGLSRIIIHPVFGHGMDAVHKHWTEWGFPGTDMLHLHSTPLQIAFDRGLLALLFWIWIVAAFWITTARLERSARDSSDSNRHGLLLGALGAVTGLLASSLVNYNFGDAEVALLFWCLMGLVVAANEPGRSLTVLQKVCPDPTIRSPG